MNRTVLNIYNKIASFGRGPNSQLPRLINRQWCSQNDVVTEEQIERILKKKFPSSQKIQVEDVSGGCGAMFNIYVESEDFKGLSIPKQHRTVYDTLKEQIKNIHGLHLETRIPR
jgi:stress-induced morphogen